MNLAKSKLSFSGRSLNDDRPKRLLRLVHSYTVNSIRQGGHVEIECGITDEGDPWLVFCDADTSNVLCHFARLGSDKYVACVPFDNVGTTGSALADVLDDFFSSPVGRGRALGLSSAVSHGKLRI